MSASVQDRFSRLAALRPTRRYVALPSDETPRGHATDVPAGAERLAEILGAAPRANRFGEHLGLRRWFSGPTGSDATFAAPEGGLDLAAARLIAPGAPECVADQQQWLFLDTETTGVVGGTGTYPFLVGVAWWDAGGLEVEQFFMREHSEEHSLLAALAERMAERRVLVTFNGKSFDWPLLETRYRMTRAIKAPSPRAHLDFLHPARNLWRLRLGSVRLAELEKHVLGWNRGADVMSELIPQMYFDYLHGGPPEPLVPIFHHNQMDLRGLAALASRVLSLLGNPEKHGQDGFELFGVSRICERRGEERRARKLYERSIAFELPPETGRAARRSLARLAKREGDHALACRLWEDLLGNSREGFEAYEQLAMHYERQTREPHRAAALARKAIAELRRANRLGTIAPHAYLTGRARFEKRLARLERKAGRTLLGALEAESPLPSRESNRKMLESDGTATQTARVSQSEAKDVAAIIDPYIREQLEKRRDEIRLLLSSIPAGRTANATAPFIELLEEVDAAVQRMDAGTYGICEVCHDAVERDRLIADPLTRLCLDHLSSDEQRALERDLELASQVQRGLLPQSSAKFGEWRIHYQYKPAGVVSGDYFDLIVPEGEDGHLIFLLGDVSGKGVAASLLMTHLHAMFRSLASTKMEFGELVEIANRLFCQSTTAGQYATLVCGRASRSGEIEIANAGHAPALVVSPSGVKQLDSTGLPLGLFASSRYPVDDVQLGPRDGLVLFTDGISEALDGAGREFGISRLSQAAGTRHGWPPNELVAACMGDVQQHSTGVRQADDQTLVAIQRLA